MNRSMPDLKHSRKALTLASAVLSRIMVAEPSTSTVQMLTSSWSSLEASTVCCCRRNIPTTSAIRNDNLFIVLWRFNAVHLHCNFNLAQKTQVIHPFPLLFLYYPTTRHSNAHPGLDAIYSGQNTHLILPTNSLAG